MSLKPDNMKIQSPLSSSLLYCLVGAAVGDAYFNASRDFLSLDEIDV